MTVGQNVTELGVVNNSVLLQFAISEDFPKVQISNIFWTFNGSILNNLTNTLTDLRYNFSGNLLNLTISLLQHRDEGVYTLTASNEAGTNSSSINLQIEGMLSVNRMK